MLQVLQLESFGGTLLLQCLLFHRLKKLEHPFRVRSSFLLFASLLLADLLVGGDMTGKVDLKWDTVIIVFGCVFLLLFCFYQSVGNRKFGCEMGLSFREIMIGSTCSVFKCLNCDQPFFFTAVYRLLNVVCALVRP